MTLCAAWADADVIWLASDSRLLFGRDSHPFDMCVKVVRTPVRVLGSGYEGAAPQPLHEFDLGLAFAS